MTFGAGGSTQRVSVSWDTTEALGTDCFLNVLNHTKEAVFLPSESSTNNQFFRNIAPLIAFQRKEIIGQVIKASTPSVATVRFMEQVQQEEKMEWGHSGC